MLTRVVVGGTFNVIHKGHRKLLETAFSVGEEVVVGIASDDFANRFRHVKTRHYVERKKDVEAYLSSFPKPFTIVEINDIYGDATTDARMDALVVSEETLLRAEEINAIRYKKGLDKLVIVVVPIVAADDGRAISGERISQGDIDAEGRPLK